MKKTLKSLIALILVIVMVVPSITVFAATGVPYAKTSTVYTVSGKSYYQAQTTSEYNGVAKGTIFWLDANFNVVTSEDTLKKLSQILLFSSIKDLLISGAEDAKNASSGYYSVFCKIAMEEDLGTLIGKVSGVALNLCSGNAYGWGEVAIDVGKEIFSAERIKTSALVAMLKIHANNADANFKRLNNLINKTITDYDSLVAAYTAYAECYASLEAIEFLAGDEVAKYCNDTLSDRILNYLINVLEGVADSVIPDKKAVEIADKLSTGVLTVIPLTELASSTKSYAVYESKKNDVYNSFMDKFSSSTETAKKLANNSTTSSSNTTNKYSTGTYKPSKVEGLNIRSGASTSYSKIGSIASGTNFVVTQVDGNWGKTTCNGVTGWVCLDYATYVNSSASTTPASESYTIDVNGYVDGIYKTGLDGYVTFDVYINGSCVKNDVGDFCTSYADGTSYEIKDIKPKNGYKYVSGRYLSGKINGGTVWVYLTLESGGADTSEATGFVEYVNGRVGETFKDGYCQAFVWQVIYNYFGKDANACCATNAWGKWKQSNSRNDIPLGATVYFGDAGEIDSYCGKDAGHSAIYVGNNTIVHAWGGKIVSTTIDYVTSRGYTYRGWGWQANYKISQPKESIPDSSHEKEDGWSEWSETKPSSKDYRTIESKTQYGYYHYVHKWTDTGFTGAYPVKDYKIFTSDPTDVLNYHEYWSDTKLSDNGSPWTGGGKSYKCYPNKCCSLGSNVSTTGKYLYDLGKTRTVYRYKDEEPEKYTITYNANGGTGAPSAQTKVHGEEIRISSGTPKKSGCNFLGWSTSENGSVKYKPGEKYNEDKNTTLYAVWEKIKTYTIRYDACGGENAPSAQTKVHGEEIRISNVTPTRQTYDFEGWATEKGGAVVYKSGDVYSENKDITLYAVWKWKLSQSAPLITVEKCVGNVGDTVDVNVLISRNIGIAGFTFNIAFDNTKLEIVSVEKSDLLKGTITTTIDENNKASTLNNIKVVYATPTDFTGNGALFTLRFKVKEGAEIGKTPITLTYRENDVVNKNLEEVGLHVENGEIDIEDILFGDVHCDGIIDTKDAVRIMQYLAGWQADICLKAADVDGDGRVTSKDSVLLSQYLAGWDIKLGEKN